MSEEIKKEKIRKVFLDDLPRCRFGKTKVNGEINWSVSIGYIVKFIYDDLEGWLEIVSYDSRFLYIKYLDKPIFKILTASFRKCKLGELLNKNSNNFKIEMGVKIKDDNRDILITNREYRTVYNKNGTFRQNQKWYKYTCNVCGWTEGWIIEGALLSQKQGCSCCYGRTTVEGINSIVDTDPWMIPYFQGGYDEAKLYTYNSERKIQPICPSCGKIKEKSIIIGGIYNNKTIGCICSDGTPYPEKVMFNVLMQLNIDLTTQLSKKYFNWCNKYSYDFYIPNLGEREEDYIIETHGLQHYTKTNRGLNLEKTQENDEYKKQLAIANGIKEENYIVVDCRYSKLDFIKQNILSSKLNDLLDLSIIDWDKVEEFALGSRVKEACEYKMNNPEVTAKEVGEIMSLCRDTIRSYFKRGFSLGWCEYDVEKERKLNYSKIDARNKKSKSKPIMCLENKMVFKSIIDCERRSEEIFGNKLDNRSICAVLKGKRKMVEGFTFKYVSDLPIEQQLEIEI